MSHVYGTAIVAIKTLPRGMLDLVNYAYTITAGMSLPVTWTIAELLIYFKGKASLYAWPPVLFVLDSAALLMLNENHFYLFGQIPTSQTGDQP